MNKLIFVFLIWTSFAYAQQDLPRSKRCKLVHDKTTGRDIYERPEVYAEPIDTNKKELKLLVYNFKRTGKTYKESKQAKFRAIIEKTGKVTFVKMLSPLNDKEVVEEAKQIVELLLYRPGMCGINPVVSQVDIKFPLKIKKPKL